MTSLLPKSCAQTQLAVVKAGTITMLLLRRSPDEGILFWDGEPVAISTAGVVYYHQADRKGGCTKAIAALDVNAPHISCDASTFDFVIGSLLTRTGLPLTMMLKGGNDAK
jgi:hypothetical protein